MASRALSNRAESFCGESLVVGIERRRRCEVLHDVAEGFVGGDLLSALAAFDGARKHLADLADDMFVAHDARLLRAQEFGALREHALAAVGDEARTDDEVVVDFGGKAKPEDYLVKIEPETGLVIGSWGGNASVDGSGFARFTNVPPGKYVLWGRPNPGADSDETKKVPVEVKGGETREVTLKAK